MKKTDQLAKIQRILQYTFNNDELLSLALTHKSVGHKNNERLEFLGDAILSMVIADLLYLQFPLASEGELTRARASLVKMATLSSIAKTLDLGMYLELGQGERLSGGFHRESILADALEALIGAIYRDSDIFETQRIIKTLFSDRLATIQPGAQEKDPKTRLQEWLQAQQMELPFYEVIAIEGEQHAQTFRVCCEIKALALKTIADGPSRRIAEQKAAQAIWEKIHE